MIGVPAPLIVQEMESPGALEYFTDAVRLCLQAGHSVASLRDLIGKIGKGPRCGWRLFRCGDCGLEFDLPTRDHSTPSTETCVRCRSDVKPVAHWPDATLPVDGSGNLSQTLEQILHDRHAIRRM